MIAFPQNEIPYDMRHLQVCVDEFREGEPKGRVYIGVSHNSCEFTSVMPLLFIIEEQLNRDKSLLRFEENRSLSGVRMVPYETDWHSSERVPGKIATFILKIHFRQNATWQGEIIWMEKKRSAYFRSALEMLFILSGVLSEETAEKSTEQRERKSGGSGLGEPAAG